jgi:serpin B
MSSVSRPLDAVNALGFRLVAEEVRNQPHANVVIGTPSLFLALALLHAGARGETRAEIAACLGVPGDDMEVIARGLLEILIGPSLEVTPDGEGHEFLLVRAWRVSPTIRTAVALWLDPGHRLSAPFAALMQEAYGADVGELDFGAPVAVEIMNAWVRAQTDGLIDRLFDTIDPRTFLCLATTLLFKGSWRYEPFWEPATQGAPFRLSATSSVLVPMMQGYGHFDYYEDESVQVLTVPYDQNRSDTRDFDFVVVLPRQTETLESVCLLLGSGTWDRWTGALPGRWGRLDLPRMDARYASEPDLNATLRTLGLTCLFDLARADLGGVFEPGCAGRAPLFLGTVVHKTALQVDETGTVAAAATGGSLAGGATPPLEFHMRVDRPFLCAIRERTSGLILFLGLIADPGTRWSGSEQVGDRRSGRSGRPRAHG